MKDKIMGEQVGKVKILNVNEAYKLKKSDRLGFKN